MTSNRPPEIELLLLACVVDLSPERKAQLIQFLGQHSIDWERLYALANRHRITPFLYQTLRQLPNIPADFLETLQRECRVIVTDNLLKQNEYERVSALLSAKAIDHIVYKGVYLSKYCYPTNGLRGIGDFDILVKREDVYKSIQILAADKYQLGSAYAHYQRYAAGVMLADLHEVSLLKPFFHTSYFDIDLHWEIECLNKKYGSIYLDDILDHPNFMQESQILLLVIHHGLLNIWQNIGYVNDLYFSLHNKTIDWSWLLQKLNQYQLETVFMVGLLWCQQLWDLPLPATIQESLRMNHLQSLAGQYEENWTVPSSVLAVNPGLRQIAFFTKCQTKMANKLKIYTTYGISFVFRASTINIGKRRLYIAKEFGPIAIFMRIIGSLYRLLPTRQ